MHRRLLSLLMVVALGGCASDGPIGMAPGIEVAATDSMPAPTRADLFAEDRAYRIGPFDKLDITVFGIGELSSEEVQVDASGRLSLPLIGVIEAAGKTPNELADEVEELLRDYVRNPQVAINLEETVSQVITVDGQVMKPGLYPVIGRMTLMRAVATAQGATEFADLKDVVVFRTVGGQRFAGLYNLKAIRRGNYEDPELYANDVIVVGDSQARRIFKDILQASPLITTPIIALLQNN